MANLGLGMYKDRIADCVLLGIEKFLLAVIGLWIAYTHYNQDRPVWAIIFTIIGIVYTILFIVAIKDTIKAAKDYSKARKDWKNYGQ